MEDTEIHRTSTSDVGRPTLHSSSCKKLSQLTKMTCLLVLALAVLPQSFAGSNPNRFQYDADGSRSYTGRNCTTAWCGEQWRSNRILYYNYTVESTLVLENKTNIETTNNCTGTQISLHCATKVTNTTTQINVRKDIYTRSKTPVVVKDSQELDHDFILSDNMIEPVFNNNEDDSERYPLNQDKIWQLSIPRGCRMRVTFEKFEIEKTKDCNRDYFSVQTSKNPNNVNVFCDRLSSIEIRWRRRVQFKLHSDNEYRNGGINAYACISNWPPIETDQPCTCQPKPKRRRRRSSLKLSPQEQRLEQQRLEEKAEQQDKNIDEWLRAMMKGGQTVIEGFLRNPVSEPQRLLALKYQSSVQSQYLSS